MLEKKLSKAKEFAVWLHGQTNNVDFKNITHKERMSFALFQQSLDVDDGIIVLLESGLPGPALALARPRFEAYVRGVWLLKAASNDAVAKFEQGVCPNFPALLNEIGSDTETGGAWIKANADTNLKDFHDLTHGGMSHILRRSTSFSIEPNYPESELIGLIQFGLEVKIRVGVEILARANLEKSMEQLKVKVEEIRNAP